MRWMRFALSSDSTRLLVASCEVAGTDSVRIWTNAPLCIGTRSCDLPSCASDTFTFAPATVAAVAATQRHSNARRIDLPLIGSPFLHDPDLHLVGGLEVFHVNAREVARRRVRARGLQTTRARRGQRCAWPCARAARVAPPLPFDIDDARDDALPHDRDFDDLHARRDVCRVRRLRR